MDHESSDAFLGLGTTCVLAVPLLLVLAATVAIVVAWSRQDRQRRSFVELLALLAAHAVGAGTLLGLVPLCLLVAYGSELASGGARIFDPHGAFGAWMNGAAAWLVVLALSGLVAGPSMMLAAMVLALRRASAKYLGAIAATACGLHHLVVAAAITTVAVTAYDAPGDTALFALLLLAALAVSLAGGIQALALAWSARRAARERASGAPA